MSYYLQQTIALQQSVTECVLCIGAPSSCLDCAWIVHRYHGTEYLECSTCQTRIHRKVDADKIAASRPMVLGCGEYWDKIAASRPMQEYIDEMEIPYIDEGPWPPPVCFCCENRARGFQRLHPDDMAGDDSYVDQHVWYRTDLSGVHDLLENCFGEEFEFTKDAYPSSTKCFWLRGVITKQDNEDLDRFVSFEVNVGSDDFPVFTFSDEIESSDICLVQHLGFVLHKYTAGAEDESFRQISETTGACFNSLMQLNELTKPQVSNGRLKGGTQLLVPLPREASEKLCHAKELEEQKQHERVDTSTGCLHDAQLSIARMCEDSFLDENDIIPHWRIENLPEFRIENFIEKTAQNSVLLDLLKEATKGDRHFAFLHPELGAEGRGNGNEYYQIMASLKRQDLVLEGKIHIAGKQYTGKQEIEKDKSCSFQVMWLKASSSQSSEDADTEEHQDFIPYFIPSRFHQKSREACWDVDLGKLAVVKGSNPTKLKKYVQDTGMKLVRTIQSEALGEPLYLYIAPKQTGKLNTIASAMLWPFESRGTSTGSCEYWGKSKVYGIALLVRSTTDVPVSFGSNNKLPTSDVFPDKRWPAKVHLRSMLAFSERTGLPRVLSQAITLATTLVQTTNSGKLIQATQKGRVLMAMLMKYKVLWAGCANGTHSLLEEENGDACVQLHEGFHCTTQLLRDYLDLGEIDHSDGSDALNDCNDFDVIDKFSNMQWSVMEQQTRKEELLVTSSSLWEEWAGLENKMVHGHMVEEADEGGVEAEASSGGASVSIERAPKEHFPVEAAAASEGGSDTEEANKSFIMNKWVYESMESQLDIMGALTVPPPAIAL